MRVAQGQFFLHQALQGRPELRRKNHVVFEDQGSRQLPLRNQPVRLPVLERARLLGGRQLVIVEKSLAQVLRNGRDVEVQHKFEGKAQFRHLRLDELPSLDKTGRMNHKNRVQPRGQRLTGSRVGGRGE